MASYPDTNVFYPQTTILFNKWYNNPIYQSARPITSLLQKHVSFSRLAATAHMGHIFGLD